MKELLTRQKANEKQLDKIKVQEVAGSGGGGAPTDATYYTASSNGSLSNEVVFIPDDATIEIDTGILQVKDGGIDATKLADGAALAEILDDDGIGSGLDADLLDGSHLSALLLKASNLSDVANAATAFSNIKQAATDSATGVVELATQTEVDTGTDTGRAITPATLRNIAELYADGDIYGLFSRLVNYGFSPDEHWRQNSDELSWTGWATYTGFATPDIISISNSIYRVAYSVSAIKAFRYRAAATGANIFLRARTSITQICSAGVMMDDGVNNADGNGANNFYRAYLTQASLGGDIQVVEQYRTGGGAVTTVTAAFTFPPAAFVGVGINSAGTLWTNWGGRPFVFGEAGASVQFTSGSGAFTWTPARVGLYWVGTAASGARQGLWDWYDEATS